MRYFYTGKAYREAGARYGFLCDPVKDDRGKCVLSKTRPIAGRPGIRCQLVEFEGGVRAVVVARALRLVSKMKNNPEGMTMDNSTVDSRGEAWPGNHGKGLRCHPTHMRPGQRFAVDRRSAHGNR